MLDQELLKRLLVISQLGSFAKAAGKLHVSRQALVEQVAALEKQLCFPIFLRTNRGTRLSRAGEIYLQNTMKLEASYDELLRRCRETTEGVQSVTIGSLPNLPGVSLPIICQKFHKYYPGVQLHFRDFSLPLYFEQFQQGLFDVTAEYIMNYYHPACDLEFLPLAKVRQHIGVLRDSPLANKRFIDFPDLRGHPLFMYREGIGRSEDQLRAYILKHEPDISIVDIDSYDNSLLTKCRMSDGVTLLYTTESFPAFQSLPAAWNIPIELGIGYHRNPPPAVSSLLTLAEELFRSGGRDSA